MLSFKDLNSILVQTTYQAKLWDKVFAMAVKTQRDETMKGVVIDMVSWLQPWKRSELRSHTGEKVMAWSPQSIRQRKSLCTSDPREDFPPRCWCWRSVGNKRKTQPSHPHHLSRSSRRCQQVCSWGQSESLSNDLYTCCTVDGRTFYSTYSRIEEKEEGIPCREKFSFACRDQNTGC